MSELAQHILTWSCPEDKSAEIRKAIQVCEDKGKFKDVCPIPDGIQFRARLKVVPPFLRELSGQHPGIRFSQEWASASRMEAGTQAYLSGELLSEQFFTPKQFADQIWSQAEYNKAALPLRSKVEANWQEYRRGLLFLPKEELIRKADEIAAVQLTRNVVMSSQLEVGHMEYLERFINPLEVLSDSWLSERNNSGDNSFGYVMWKLRDSQDAELDYDLEPEHQSSEQSM